MYLSCTEDCTNSTQDCKCYEALPISHQEYKSQYAPVVIHGCIVFFPTKLHQCVMIYIKDIIDVQISPSQLQKTVSQNTFSQNAVSQNTVSQNTVSKNTVSQSFVSQNTASLPANNRAKFEFH